MKNTKTNLTQITNTLNTNYYHILNVNNLNKNKQIKTTKVIENNNVFITENSVHFDSNVIIKKNSQFLPKIKNYVKKYQTEMFKLNYWPSLTNGETTQIIDYSITKKNKEQMSNKKGEIVFPTHKKVEISKLNTNKKGSLINNKIIENLNSNTLASSLQNKQLSPHFLNDKDSKGKGADSIFKYLNTMSINKSKLNTGPNLSKKYGTLLKYNKIISYSFLQNKQTILVKNSPNNIYKEEIAKIMNSEYIEETYKLLFIYFKSIYCLISKPVISITPDKVNIQLFYYLNIPKKKTIKLFAIHYLNSFKNKWLNNSPLVLQLGAGAEGRKSTTSQSPQGTQGSVNRNRAVENSRPAGVKIRLPFINRKARKSISRFKSKPSYFKNIIFNLIKYNIAKVFSFKFKLICDLLSRKFNKPVELELIRLHNPYLDTNILANLLHLIIKNKKKKPKIAIDKIYNKNQVKKINDPNLISVNNKPAFLSGLNFYINGRTMGEAIVPRMTTKSFEKGATATGKVNFLDKSTITKKNKKGAYTIKVISAQNFF